MATLNPYSIKWDILSVRDGIITKKQSSQLAKIGYARYAKNVMIRHSPSDDVAKERRKLAIDILKKDGKKGQSVIITDKQFGLTKITYDGKIPSQFSTKTSLAFVDGKRVILIPVTALQMKQAKKF